MRRTYRDRILYSNTPSHSKPNFWVDEWIACAHFWAITCLGGQNKLREYWGCLGIQFVYHIKRLLLNLNKLWNNTKLTCLQTLPKTQNKMASLKQQITTHKVYFRVKITTCVMRYLEITLTRNEQEPITNTNLYSWIAYYDQNKETFSIEINNNKV